MTGRGKKLGAALLAVAARVEGIRAGLSQEVSRQSEQAASSRAAAVAGAQQQLAQASMIVDLVDSSGGFLLLPGAVASAGGPKQGVSVLSSGFPSLELNVVTKNKRIHINKSESELESKTKLKSLGLKLERRPPGSLLLTDKKH